jgi:hypothetical protein
MTSEWMDGWIHGWSFAVAVGFAFSGLLKLLDMHAQRGSPE